jgi:RNA polymerase sigma factor (sigma-70 family)
MLAIPLGGGMLVDRGAQARCGIEARPSAVERLMASLLPWLVRWTHHKLPARARRRMDSDDFVQEALIGALQHLPDFAGRAPEALLPYLQQSIRNRIRDEIRRAGKVETGGTADDRAPDRAPSALDRAIDAEHEARLRTALARLEPGERALVVGRVELHLSYLELAEATGRPSAEAARAAARRAVIKLARLVAGA